MAILKRRAGFGDFEMGAWLADVVFEEGELMVCTIVIRVVGLIRGRVKG